MTYLLYISLYTLFTYSLYRIAVRCGVAHPWLAFIPFMHMWLPVSIAKVPKRKWFILLFVPLINIVAIWFVWGKVAQKLERSVWLGRLMLIPLINILVLPMFAFNLYPKDFYNALQKMIRKESVVELDVELEK